SGFLITGIISRGIGAGTFSFRKFYYRRAKRLLPAAYVVIAVTVLLAPWFLSELAIEDLKAQVIGALTFTANVVLWMQTGYFEAGGETKALLHFWSLAIEEQYYMVMPLLLFLLPRPFWLPVVAGIMLVLGAASPYFAWSNPDAAFFLPHTRAWELAVGSFGALLPARYLGTRALSLARVPAIAVLLSIPFFPTGLPHPGVDAMLVCLATLVIILGHDNSRWEKILPARGLAFVGDFSYSLYLVHWPIVVFTKAAWLEGAPPHALAIAVALSFVLAWLLFRFVEEPFRQGFNRYPARTVGTILAASLVIATAPTAISAATASSVDFTKMLRRNYGLDTVCADRAAGFTELPAECRSTDNPKILVWGDSFAMMWAKALADAMPDKGVLQATLPRCSPMFRSAISSVRASKDRRQESEDCLDFNNSVMDLIVRSTELETVVVSSPFAAPLSRGAYLLTRGADGKVDETRLNRDLSIEQMKTIAETIRASGKKLVFIAPPPRLKLDMAACQERLMRGLVTFTRYKNCAIPEASWRRTRKRTIDFLDDVANAGVPVLYPSDFLCTEGVCATAMDGTIIYRDHGHLSY
ncbi:MAG: acyltransferase, partial [Gammaproteobacteria bacterium]|nr:acyltransferase [Gammaproteobacteria bacterium]